MTKSEMIDSLLKSGNESALFQLVQRLSDFNERNNDSAHVQLSTLEDTRLVGTAREHLKFISKFGRDKRHVFIEGKHHFAYPEKFQEWISAGSPGVSENELRKLCESLKLNPS